MFYNHVTHAFKQTHPRNWMENQAKFHKFMTSEILNNHGTKHQDTPVTEEFDTEDVVIEVEETDVSGNEFFL